MKKKDVKIQALRVIYCLVDDGLIRGSYDFDSLGFSNEDAIKIEKCVNEILSGFRSKYESNTGASIFE